MTCSGLVDELEDKRAELVNIENEEKREIEQIKSNAEKKVMKLIQGEWKEAYEKQVKSTMIKKSCSQSQASQETIDIFTNSIIFTQKQKCKEQKKIQKEAVERDINKLEEKISKNRKEKNRLMQS